MQRIEILAAQLEHEAQTARRFIERLPDDQFSWRPHPKSSTAGALASHFVDCIRFAAPIFSGDELDIDPSTFAPFSAATTRELLEVFDAEVARATQAIRQTNDPDATQPWRMLFNGRVIFTRPREAAFQDMTLSHLVHHRGQLSVYLRLLDIPVPPSYGPTADER